MFRFDDEFRAEFRAGWPVLIIAFVCFLFGFAAPAFSLPFIYPEVIKEFGWTREQATLLASSKYAVGALSALLAGRLVDVIGAWVSLIITIALGGLALVSFLWIQNLTGYYMVGVLLGVAAGGTMVSIKVLISRAFNASQGSAMGLAHRDRCAFGRHLAGCPAAADLRSFLTIHGLWPTPQGRSRDPGRTGQG